MSHGGKMFLLLVRLGMSKKEAYDNGAESL